MVIMSVFPNEPTQSYLTPEELRLAPMTRNIQHFFPSNTPDAESYAELQRIILRGSAEVNTFCNQPLHSHTDVCGGRVPVNHCGRLLLNPRHDPITALVDVKVGTSPADLIDLDITAAEVSPHHIEIPMGSLIRGPLPYSTYAVWTYVAGYDLNQIPEDIVSATILLIDANLEFADTYALTVTRDDRGGLSDGNRRKRMIEAAHEKLSNYMKSP